MSTKARLREFIITELEFGGAADSLTDDYPLLEREVVDSIGIFRIVAFLEDDFGIEVDDQDLVPDNFSSISSIANLVVARQAT